MSELLAQLLREFTDGFYERSPMVAVNNGLHRYDGRLPDFSPEGIESKVSWLERMRARAQAIDLEGLTAEETLYRDYLVIVIDTDLFNIRELRVFENNTWFDYLALDPNLYLSREYATLVERMDAYTRHVQAMPAALGDMKRTIKPMPSGHAAGFRSYLDGLATFVTTAPYDVFAGVDDSGRQEAMKRANDLAAAALGDLSGWIESAPRNEEFALGGQKFAEFLWSLERLDVSLEDLQAMAERDLERNMGDLERACERYAPGSSVSEVRAEVAARKPADGPVAAASRQLDRLKQLILDRDIIAIPDCEVVVAESPPHMRSGTAYISVAGPHESLMPSYYYVSPPDPSWSLEDQQLYMQSEADLMTVSTHTVWPGHILEAVCCHRPGNPLAAFTYSYAFCEGWCVYSEEMMLHEALDDDPELAIGQLQNALMGDVRVLVSIGLHAEGMTIAEAERAFLEKAFCDPASAREDAIRGSFDPGYLFYTVGKWMVLKLREDWRALHPEASLRDFHEAFFSYGDVPIVLLRRVLLGAADNNRPLPELL